MKEIWKDIEGFENLYQISNLGRVLSKGRNINNAAGIHFRPDYIMKPIKDKHGYMTVKLKSKDKTRLAKVHRLVAAAFIPNPENKPQVNHIDGNKTNNVLSNLEWVTPSENLVHAYENELNKKPRIVIQMDKDGKFIRRWTSMAEIHRVLGIHRNIIRAACCRDNNITHGYRWLYEEDYFCNIINAEVAMNKAIFSNLF